MSTEKGKGAGKNRPTKSQKSHVLAMVMKYENKAAEATKETAKAKSKKTVEVKVKPSVAENEALKQAKPAPKERTSTTRRHRRSEAHKVEEPELMKQVKKHYYGELNGVKSSWADKVIEDLLEEVFPNKGKPESKDKESPGVGVQSDESGDDLTMTAGTERVSNKSPAEPTGEQENLGDMSSGDTSDRKDLADVEADEEEEQFRLFCDKLQPLLEQVSGFSVPSVSLNKAQFRTLMQQFDVTSAAQLLTGSQIVYQPEVVVVSNVEELKSRFPQETTGTDGSGMPEKARSMHILDKGVFFIPNKLHFA